MVAKGAKLVKRFSEHFFNGLARPFQLFLKRAVEFKYSEFCRGRLEEACHRSFAKSPRLALSRRLRYLNLNGIPVTSEYSPDSASPVC